MANYCRKDVCVNEPYTDSPAVGPFVPDYTTSVSCNNNPNPVPNTYLAPGHNCCPKDRNICPMHHVKPDPGCEYVTKHELNNILANLARATVFTDDTETGTTTSVGGIRKGTKLTKITLVKLIELMLYSGMADTEYAYLDDDGEEVLNTIVKYPIGDLQIGDDLKGLTISQILERMLCGKKETEHPPNNIEEEIKSDEDTV